MENKQVIIITTESQLENTISKVLQKQMLKADQKKDLNHKMSRREAAKFMGISYQSMFNYTQKGFIKEHGIARKKFYLKNELIEAMKNNVNL